MIGWVSNAPLANWRPTDYVKCSMHTHSVIQLYTGWRIRSID